MLRQQTFTNRHAPCYDRDMSECPFRETCARMGGICQCAEETQQDDEDRRRSELGDTWDGP